MKTNEEANPNVIDPSFDELESMMSGTSSAPVKAEPVEDPSEVKTPTTEDRSKQEPEAAAVETPAAEPGKKAEGEEKTPEQQEQQQDADQHQQDGKDGKPGKKKDDGWVDKRLSSLAQKRREAEANEREARQIANDERTRRERVERELEALKSGKPGPAAQADEGSTSKTVTTPAAGQFDKPKPSVEEFTQPGGKHFKEGEDYDQAVQRAMDAQLDWRDEKREFDQKQKATNETAEEQKKAFLKDIEVAMDKHPDWEDSRQYVVRKSAPALQSAISNLPKFADGQPAWTEVVAYLADNPDELQSINETFAGNQVAGMLALGEIYNSLKPTAGATKKPAPAATATSTAQPAAPRKAATPPAVIGGGSAPAPVDLEEADMDTFAIEMKKAGI